MRIREIDQVLGGSTTTLKTVYDGGNVWADYDANDALSERYLYGRALDQLFARLDGAGAAAWYLTDQLGSVRDIADLDGNLVDHVQYASFGSVLAETNPSAGDRFKFTAREFDAFTGDYFYRARYYNPALGRFISQDPIGFAGKDSNLYRYVQNIVTIFIDPTGLDVGTAWWNPWAWLGPVWAIDIHLHNMKEEGKIRGEIQRQHIQLQQTIGNAGPLDQRRRAVEQQHQKPLGESTAVVVAGAATVAAGAYGNAFGFATPKPAMLPPMSQLAKRRLGKELGGIPRSSQPIRQGRFEGGKWWEYKDSSGEVKIVVEHSDGTVHVGTPKPQSLHGEGKGPPKYYEEPGTGHVGGG